MEEIIIKVKKSDLPESSKKVYIKLLDVPKGKVTTYKALADSLGTKAYRNIGRVMATNPFIPDVPCHRVVGSDGRLTGYALGLDKKEELLMEEGINISDGRVDRAQIITAL